MLVIGHRGAMGHAPENTLLSMRKALELGVNFIELDIHAVGGELVVIHDARFERTTNGRGLVAESRLDYLRSLDAGQGEKIPLLSEVFDLVDRRAGIMVEIKPPGCAELLAPRLHSYIERGWSYDQIQICSFNHFELKKMKQIDRRFQLGALLFGLPLTLAQFGSDLEAYSVNVSIDQINGDFVADARRRGLKVYVYTVNDPQDIKRVSELKVDGIISNFPERVKSLRA